MAFFQKKPQTSDSAPLYTLGLNTTVLVVGLGNPGKKYQNTRHNIGYESVEAFSVAHNFPKWVHKKDQKSFISAKSLGNVHVVLCKPLTYMNLSGEAVQMVAHFYKIPPSSILVVHDELDIPFGQIRTRLGGSAAGHNGIKSLIQQLGEQFPRVRVGIGGSSIGDSSAFVLSKFNKEEISHMQELTRETTSILTEYIYRGELQPETRSFII